MKKLVLLLCLFVVSTLFAQERNCSAMENLNYRMQKDPNLKQRMENIEAFTQQRVQQYQTNRIDGSVITIPVVVHVIYNNANENISDAQIQSQLDVLNEDFRRTNSDANNVWSQAADTEIEFCLATVDPNGNATTGITRKSSNKSSWGTNDAMKKSSQGGVDPWDTSQYLNMWVCNIGSGLLGYAQFPGGSAATDGVVMGPNYFGSSDKGSGFYLSAPFDKGRTTTHEVGHYLNLRHIWGDGACGTDDFVSDTPESDAANYGCSTGHSSCGTTDMVQNYMDYSDDSCMNLFTLGQKNRMRSVLEPGGFRYNLALSDKCGSAPPPTCTDGIQNGDETGVDCGGSSCAPCNTSCTENEVIVSITFDNYPEETSWNIKNDAGTTVASGTYSSTNADGSTITETLCLTDDCYTFTINDTYGDGICCSYGNGSYTVTGSDGTIQSGGSFGASEATDFCLGGGTPTPTCTDGIQNGDETGIDCGGSACAPCNTNGTVTLHEGFFESGWDGWTDGGSDCYRYSGSRSYENNYSIRLRDNSGTSSAMTSSAFNLSGYNQVEVTFFFYSYSMENGEDFFLRFYNGSSWSTVASWASGSNFSNNNFYSATVTLDSSNYNFATNSQFRFQCDASANADHIYIDQVTIKGINGARSIRNNDITYINSLNDMKDMGDVILYPNPVKGGKIYINKNYELNPSYRIVNMLGQTIETGTTINGGINVDKLKAGLYIIEFSDSEETVTQKFIKQ